MPWIRRIRLRNYRSFDDCEITLQRKAVIVGANNVGKTSLLEAIDGVFGAGRRGYGFDEDDLRRGAPDGSQLILDFTILPDSGEKFSADQHALFSTHVDIYDGNCEQLLIRLDAGVDPREGVFRARGRFLKSDGGDDGPLAPEHREALATAFFSARRDARRELSDRSGIWSRITSTSRMSPQQLEDALRHGETAGEAIVRDLLGPAIGIEILAASVNELISTVLYGGTPGTGLVFSATPLDIRQLLRQIEVRLQTPGDAAARPLLEHSTGTQSILILGLFVAYVETLDLPMLAICVEEPEVHLFPHAARSLSRRLAAVPEQTVLTTHSTVVTDLADPRNIVVLRRRGDCSVACSVPDGYLTDDDATNIARRMRSVGSSFLFARSVLVMEGESEELAFPIFAEHLGIDLDSLAISLVKVDGNSFGAFAKLLSPDSLSIPFLIVCDNDGAVQRLVRELDRAGLLPQGVDRNDPQAGRHLLEAAGYYWWSTGDFESCLLAGGAHAVFRQAITELYGAQRLAGFEGQFQKVKGRPPSDDLELIIAFLRSKGASKPRIALRVAELMCTNNLPVPTEIQQLLKRLAQLARSQMEIAAGGPASSQS